jgi:hypothetical protein
MTSLSTPAKIKSTVHGWSQKIARYAARNHPVERFIICLLFLCAFIVYFILLIYYDPALPVWASIIASIPFYFLSGVLIGMTYCLWVRLYERARQQEAAEGKVASAEARANATADAAAKKLTFPERVVRRLSALPRTWLRPEMPSSEPTLLFDIEEYTRTSHRESALKALEGFDDVELGRVATPSQLV